MIDWLARFGTDGEIQPMDADAYAIAHLFLLRHATCFKIDS
jgi:hypothetical protein